MMMIVWPVEAKKKIPLTERGFPPGVIAKISQNFAEVAKGKRERLKQISQNPGKPQ